MHWVHWQASHAAVTVAAAVVRKGCQQHHPCSVYRPTLRKPFGIYTIFIYTLPTIGYMTAVFHSLWLSPLCRMIKRLPATSFLSASVASLYGVYEWLKYMYPPLIKTIATFIQVTRCCYGFHHHLPFLQFFFYLATYFYFTVSMVTRSAICSSVTFYVPLSFCCV